MPVQKRLEEEIARWRYELSKTHEIFAGHDEERAARKDAFNDILHVEASSLSDACCRTDELCLLMAEMGYR